MRGKRVARPAVRRATRRGVCPDVCRIITTVDATTRTMRAAADGAVFVAVRNAMFFAMGNVVFLVVDDAAHNAVHRTLRVTVENAARRRAKEKA